MQKVLKWAGLALLLFYIVTQPQNAAGMVRSIGGGLQGIAVGLGEFITHLV
ncbi:MAG TPA: hypothetical protein VGR21_00665 [Cryptosporangiaceae bacterium]|nr:hypothetical protein [Cryptosporangiaceae bacterium]